MGIASLRELAVLEETSLEALSGSIIAVDAHNWLYRYLTTTVRWTKTARYTTTDGEEVANLIGIVRGLPKFYEHDMHPVFIFDGAVPDLKADEVEARRTIREHASQAATDARESGDIVEASRLDAQSQRLTPVIQRTTRELFDLLDVPYVDAPGEGEAQGAYLAREGAVDYVGTEDYDSLLFGAPETIRKLTTNDNPERMSFLATLEKHDITHEQLVDIAILCGTDFNEGLSGFGPKTALKQIKEHGRLEDVLTADGRAIPEADAVRQLFLDPTVTKDVSFSIDPSPNLSGARAYITEEWEIPDGEIETAFDRLTESMTQQGLNRWS